MSLTVSAGQIPDNGQPFIAEGINIFADALMTFGAAMVTNTFPGLNFVRVDVFDMTTDTAAMLKPYVDALTSQGVVVELEDHNSHTVLIGSALNSAVLRYTDWATAFEGNPNVVFGTQNEPVGSSSSIDGEISAIYNAIRATGNNNLVLMDPNAGNLDNRPRRIRNLRRLERTSPGIFTTTVSFRLQPRSCCDEFALSSEVAGAQGIRSAQRRRSPSSSASTGRHPGNETTLWIPGDYRR